MHSSHFMFYFVVKKNNDVTDPTNAHENCADQYAM